MERTEQNSDGARKRSSFFHFPVSFYLFPLIHLAVAIPLAYHLNIWSDEASTLFSTQDGVFAAISNSANEKQAPLYFVLLSLWRLVDDSIFFARLSSILCSVVSIALFFKIVRRFWNSRTALFATFFFSAHPFLFWASTEIRVYSLVILLSLLLIWIFEKNFLSQEKTAVWESTAFVGVAVTSLYTNYYLGFLLVGFFAALLILQRFDAARRYVIAMIFAGLLFLPMILLSTMQMSGAFDGAVLETGAVEGFRRVWGHVLTFGLPTELFPPEDQTYVSFIRIWVVRVLVLAAAAALLLRRKLPGKTLLLFGALSVVVSVFLLAAFYLLGMLYVEIRHASVLFGPFMLFMTALLIELSPMRRKKLYVTAIGLVLTASYIYALTAMHPNWIKRGDWARVARFVEQNEKAGQPVVVFRNYEALAFDQSYHGINKVLPEDKYFDWNYEGKIGTPETWPRQIGYVISVFPRDSQYIWLATEELCQTTPSCEPLEKFVKENYTVELTQDFYKERLRLLRKR